MTNSTRRIVNISRPFLALLAVVFIPLCISSCAHREIESNKEERNAIKKGNENYKIHDFASAVRNYDAAIQSNPSSEVAKLNKAVATFLSNESDSTDRKNADSLLVNLATSATNIEVTENALYNQANIYVNLGDQLKELSQTEGEQGMAQAMSQESTKLYKAAIENYKELLRRKPGDLKVTQNLRITQLKLPPEDQNNDDQQQQDQQQDQQQQQQDQQQQQQPQPQADALNALQKREAQTRKRQVEPVQPNIYTSDKPW